MTTEAVFFVAGLIVGGLIVGTIVGIWVYRVALIGAEEWVQDHLAEDHLRIENEPSDAGLDVERLFAELRHTLETAPAWEWDEHAGNNYLHRSNVLAIVDEQYAITLRLTDPDADGAPFPAGVNRADSEGGGVSGNWMTDAQAALQDIADHSDDPASRNIAAAALPNHALGLSPDGGVYDPVADEREVIVVKTDGSGNDELFGFASPTAEATPRHHHRSFASRDACADCRAAMERFAATSPAADLARWLQDTIESQPAITIRRGVEPQVAWRALADELLRRWGR